MTLPAGAQVGNVDLRNRFLNLVCIALAAALGAASTAWPFQTQILVYGEPVWWLQIASIASLHSILVRQIRARDAFWAALAYATVHLALTFSWLYVAMHTYGGLDAWMAVAAVFGLAIGLSFYYACAATLHHKLRGQSAFVSSLTFAAVWTAAELARGTWLTGFGWGASGYAHTTGPLAAYAPYVGAYGVGALAVWISASLASIRDISRAQIAGITLLLLGGALLPHLQQWTTSQGTMSVTLLQGNIAQSEKFEESTGVPAALNWYASQIATSKSDLTVAPETAIPLLPWELPADYWSTLLGDVAKSDRAILTGIPLGDYSQGYTNSVVAISAAGETYRYDKHHLVPFGEFIPPMFRWFTTLMRIPLGDFNRGAMGQASFAFLNQRLAPNICYEDLFGEELGARFVDDTVAPTIFVNVSNLGWFGGGVVIDQHLQISRMRALEFERPFVRATNTGATVIMNHRGQVISALPRMTQGTLSGTVEGRSGLTPFAWWVSRFGLWPLWFVIAACVALGRRSQLRAV
jgi:apolipoprotein N-acyltransferase